MRLDDLARSDPNFTILVPGGCNAKCDFCFWNASHGRIRPPADYIERLQHLLLNLPSNFTAISVSGGEPSISPHLIPVLAAINAVRAQRHYDRVVLTSNGSNLTTLLEVARAGLIDHLNISRHSTDDTKNAAVFKSRAIPSTLDLRQFIDGVHKTSAVDVTMNAVVPADLQFQAEKESDTDTARQLIDYAAIAGFDAISLRKVASDVSPTPAEIESRKRYKVKRESMCPVCRGMVQDYAGFEVRWKGSVAEPSVVLGKLYELVFHPDGQAYADWDMQVPVRTPRRTPISRPQPQPPVERIIERVVYQTAPAPSAPTGCGSRGC